MIHMPDSIFRALKRFYDNPSFRGEVVQEGSMAARSLCMWVRAVYEFCLVYRALEPKRQQLQKAEQELEKVMLVDVTCFHSGMSPFDPGMSARFPNNEKFVSERMPFWRENFVVCERAPFWRENVVVCHRVPFWRKNAVAVILTKSVCENEVVAKTSYR